MELKISHERIQRIKMSLPSIILCLGLNIWWMHEWHKGLHASDVVVSIMAVLLIFAYADVLFFFYRRDIFPSPFGDIISNVQKITTPIFFAMASLAAWYMNFFHTDTAHYIAYAVIMLIDVALLYKAANIDVGCAR